MRKIIYASGYFCLLFISTHIAAQQKDEPIELKFLSIEIRANMFIATTIMNMEFYNPNAKVLDGTYNFSLNEGQVITGFALDINGFMREGVITDKQKGRIAYENTIRRRVDPGLLEMTAANNYRIRIYPMSAMGIRKIKIIIAEQLFIKDNSLQYHLPLDIPYTVKSFEVLISVKSLLQTPVAEDGLIKGIVFKNNNDSFSLRH